MEFAGRDIDDEALRAAMRDTGLGTPATRAATIETLLKRKFIVRDGKNLVPTDLGVALIRAVPVASLASPELTGAWEARLARVARGHERRADFMGDIVRYVGEMVEAFRGAKPQRTPGPAAPVAPPARPPVPRAAVPERRPVAKPPAGKRPAKPIPARPRAANQAVREPAVAASGAAAEAGEAADAKACPLCRRGTLMPGKRGWGCSRWREGCGFVLWFHVADQRISDSELRDLIQKGRTRRRRWPRAAGGEAVLGRLVLDLAAPRAAGAARFEPG